MSTSSLRQITLTSDPEKIYFLQTEWSGGGDLGAGFSLVLSDGGTAAWTGEVSADEVAGEIRDMGVERERYVEDLRAALTGSEEEEGYSFDLSPDSDPVRRRLSYRKTCKGISLDLGWAELRAVPGDPAETSRSMLVQSLRRSAALQAENGALREENERLRREHRRVAEELRRWAEEKGTTERELYARFVTVLNAKKAKIRGLRDDVRRLQQQQQQQQQQHGRSRGDSSDTDDGGMVTEVVGRGRSTTETSSWEDTLLR